MLWFTFFMSFSSLNNSMGLLTLLCEVKLLSHVWLLATPWTVAYQAPPSMGFSRQEYWSGLPFASPGDLPDPGIEPRSPTLQADTLTSEPPGKPEQDIWCPTKMTPHNLWTFHFLPPSILFLFSPQLHFIPYDTNSYSVMIALEQWVEKDQESWGTVDSF